MLIIDATILARRISFHPKQLNSIIALIMSSSTFRHRTQTLRQAKAAYRKSGPGHRFTEVELRQINRNAELLERADRIKKREQNKKSNKKNKEQKQEKEKEARRKVGLSEVREAYISPSQPKLDAFLPMGIQQKRESRDCTPVNEIELHSKRSPLKPKSGNETIRSVPLDFGLPDNPFPSLETEWADFIVSNTQIAQELLPPKTKDENPAIKVGITPYPLTQISPGKECTLMAPTQKAHKDDLIIEHEFSDDDSRGLNSEDCLVVHAVQGDCFERQEVIVEEMSTIQENDYEFGDEFTDDDLQRLAQEILYVPKHKSIFEPQSVVSEPKCVKKIALHQEINEDSVFDDYKPSSQDLLNLLCDNDFDSSIISTQELLDLVP